MKKDVSNKALIWTAVWSIAGLLIFLWILSLGPTAEEIAQEEAIAERNAENQKLRADREKAALDLRDEVLNEKWNHLFENEVGSPSEITIDEKHGARASTGGVSINGTAMIDGVKYEFFVGFDKKGDEVVQDQFRVSKWEKYIPKSSGDIHGAWAYMQLFVEKRLKNPNGANFVGNARDVVTNLGDGKYRIAAAVDATNSFGATVRTPFSGVIENLGDEWKLHDLNIEQ